MQRDWRRRMPLTDNPEQMPEEQPILPGMQPGAMPGMQPGMMMQPGMTPGAIPDEPEIPEGGPEGIPAPQAEPVYRHITEEDLIRATDILRRYKAGKASVERRVIAAQNWWKLRNWREIEHKDGRQGADRDKSATAWLWNCIVGKHADTMDSFPEPAILPRAEDDKEEAERLTSIVPVILQVNGFEEVYSEVAWQKMREGTGIYGVFFDRDKLNGLGDITISKINVLNLFWEPGITDIQDSRHVFHVALMDNDLLEQQYPQLEGKLGQKTVTVASYQYDDSVDITDKSLVIDWYYHRYQGGRKILHYVKFVGTTVLYATEDDPEYADRGLYDDGLYPFVFDRLFPVEGSPCGYGYIDVGRDTQKDIDTINQAVVMNAVVSATPRYFVRKDGGINEAEFADLRKPFVHTGGQLGQDTLMQIQTAGIQGNVLSFFGQKIDELKFITGNTDVQNGSVAAGVTAASAIAALQEYSGRSSKDSTRSAYRAYARLVTMVIERIRQFYDMPRQFRIIGPRGEEKFMTYSNAGIVPQYQGMDFGVDMGYRLPAFDIDVKAQRMTGYTRAAQNELALQLLQAGIFNPQAIDQSMLCLDMMDFKEKDELQQKLSEMGGMQQQLQQLYQIAITQAQQLGDAATVQQLTALAQQSGMAPVPQEVDTAGINEDGQRNNTIIQKARDRSAQAARVD